MANKEMKFRCFEIPMWVRRDYNTVIPTAFGIMVLLAGIAAGIATWYFFNANPMKDFNTWLVVLGYVASYAIYVLVLRWFFWNVWHERINRRCIKARKYVWGELGLLLGNMDLEYELTQYEVEVGLAQMAHFIEACKWPGYASDSRISRINGNIGTPAAIKGMFGYARALARLMYKWDYVRFEGDPSAHDHLDKEVLRRLHPVDTRSYNLHNYWGTIAGLMAHAPDSLIQKSSEDDD